MKILLVQPAPKVWMQSKTLPLGLAYLGAVLEKAGHRVSVIDYSIEKDKPLQKADLVGITATTPLISHAWQIAQKIKEKFGATTVLGGPHVTALPDESLEKKEVDIVVRNEGEETILELVGALERKKSLKNITGISFKANGKKIHNPPRILIQNLDLLPFPARHLFPPLETYTNPQPLLSSKIPAVNIITSRGCPFGCNFCFKGVFGRIWRARSPQNVLVEWKELIEKYKVREIGIQDDIFNTDVKRAIQICELIIKNKLIVPWSTPNGIRADLLPEELVRKMKEAGCYRVAFGIESGNQKMLKEKIGKNLNLREVAKAVKLCQKYGIKTIGFFIIGHPWDTKKTVEETINFAINSGLDYAQFTIANPIPGSGLYEFISQNGRFLTQNWEDSDHYKGQVFFEYGNINEEFITWAQKEAYRKFYLRPSYLAKVIFSKDTLKNWPYLWQGMKHFLLQKD